MPKEKEKRKEKRKRMKNKRTDLNRESNDTVLRAPTPRCFFKSGLTRVTLPREKEQKRSSKGEEDEESL